MSNQQCPNCAFLNVANAIDCKQCGARLAGNLKTQPSLTKIIKNDALLQMLLLIPIVFSGLFIIVNVFGLVVSRRNVSIDSSDQPIFLFLAVGSAVIVAGIVAWRVSSVRKIFSQGKEVSGRITNWQATQKSIAQIYCTYVFDGFEYDNKIEVMQRFNDKKFLESLHNGKSIALVVNPAKPTQVFIKDLYLS